MTTVASYFMGHGVPVFMLHRMLSARFSNPGGVSEAFLRECLQYLNNNHYHFLSLEELVQALTQREPIPSRSVVFTMDDGYLDQAEIALPIFEEFGCPITFFVITGMLDQNLWPWDAKIAWLTQATDKQSLIVDFDGVAVNLQLDTPQHERQSRRAIQDHLKTLDADRVPGIIDALAKNADVEIPQQAPTEFRPMTWALARQYESDLVRFAPHSDSHNILSRLDDKSLEQELSNCWRKISSELDNPVKIFCYPTGRPEDYGPREIDRLKQLGYIGAVSTTAASVDLGDHSWQQRFTLPRYSLPSTMGDFIQYCSWIEFIRNKDADRNPRQGKTPADKILL